MFKGMSTQASVISRLVGGLENEKATCLPSKYSPVIFSCPPRCPLIMPTCVDRPLVYSSLQWRKLLLKWCITFLIKNAFHFLQVFNVKTNAKKSLQLAWSYWKYILCLACLLQQIILTHWILSVDLIWIKAGDGNALPWGNCLATEIFNEPSRNGPAR